MMRRASFSIGGGRFLPAIATVNTAGFFQSFRFHSIGTKDYRNELTDFAQLPWQQWKDKGLDPVKFSQELKKQKFYRGDGIKLLELLNECCRMAIAHSASEIEADKIAVVNYAWNVMRVISLEFYLGREPGYDGCDHIAYRGPDGSHELYAVRSTGDELLAKFTSEKKEGPTVEMVRTLNELFGYVLTMNLKDSAPSAESPRL